MRIGIDLDGVIFNSEYQFQCIGELFDLKHGGKGLSHPEEVKMHKRYDWTEDMYAQYLDEAVLPTFASTPLMPMAKEVMSMLENDGHEIYIVTSRNLPKEIEITLNRLSAENINYPTYFQKDGKLETCQRLDIDVMIDDYYVYVEELSNAGITCIQLVTEPIKEVHRHNVHVCHNWGEVYRTMLDLSKNLPHAHI